MIVKRILFFIRGQIFPDDMLPTLIKLLQVFVKENFSVDVIRWICTFIISTLPKGSTLSFQFKF